MAFRIDVDEAHTEFDQMIARVEAGEEVFVQRHGTDVARVVALRAPRDDLDELPEDLRRPVKRPLSP